MQKFNPYIYEKDKNPNYLKFARMATVGELYDFARKALEEAGILEKLEYFEISHGVNRDDPLLENLWGIAIYVITGASEGHYLHIDAFEQGSSGHRALITGKDLCTSMDTALAAVNVLAPLIS